MISVIQELRTAFLDAGAVSVICTEKVLARFDAMHLLSPQSVREKPAGRKQGEKETKMSHI